MEPLHLKNNAWQHFFRGVLKESIRKTKLPKTCKKFSDVPVDSAFSQVITSLQLTRKVKEWFDDTQGLGVDLHRQVVINVNGQQNKTCLGGIHVPYVLEILTNALMNMKNQYLDQLPQNMPSIDLGRLVRTKASIIYNINSGLFVNIK